MKCSFELSKKVLILVVLNLFCVIFCTGCEFCDNIKKFLSDINIFSKTNNTENESGNNIIINNIDDININIISNDNSYENIVKTKEGNYKLDLGNTSIALYNKDWEIKK